MHPAHAERESVRSVVAVKWPAEPGSLITSRITGSDHQLRHDRRPLCFGWRTWDHAFTPQNEGDVSFDDVLQRFFASRVSFRERFSEDLGPEERPGEHFEVFHFRLQRGN